MLNPLAWQNCRNRSCSASGSRTGSTFNRTPAAVDFWATLRVFDAEASREDDSFEHRNWLVDGRNA